MNRVTLYEMNKSNGQFHTQQFAAVTETSKMRLVSEKRSDDKVTFCLVPIRRIRPSFKRSGDSRLEIEFTTRTFLDIMESEEYDITETVKITSIY